MPNSIDYACSPYLFPPSDDILCFSQFIVEECIELPQHKPNIQKLVDCKVTPVIESFRIINSPKGKKVFIRGKLEQEILYVVDSLCQPVHALDVNSPFSTYIDLWNCGTTEFDKLEAFKPKILVEFMEAVQICHRSIRKHILLFAWYPRGIITPPKPPLPPHPPFCPPCPPPPVNVVQECKINCKPGIFTPKTRVRSCREEE